MITDQVVRELAEFDGDGSPVTTCYLNVDGRQNLRTEDVERELERLVRRAATVAADEPSVSADLQRITAHVRDGIDRKGVRGLAMFSCAPQEFWKVIALPLPVHSRISVGHAPSVAPLESMVEQLRPTGVLLVDRQRARLFIYEMGELTERSEQVAELPRDYDIRDQSSRGEPTAHVEELVLQHLRHAAKAAFDLFHDREVGRIAVGGAVEAVGQVEELLHPYLKERLVGRLHLAAAAPADEVRDNLLALQAQAERDAEATMVARLRDAVGAGSKGVAGLDDTLEALCNRRVDVLLVSSGFEQPGWKCAACGALATVGATCPNCGAEMSRVDDVVDEAIQEALSQSCRLEVCVDNADLDVLGRIGALLRY